MLEGVMLPSKIAARLEVTPDLIRRVQDDTEFIRFYDAAKQEMAVSGIDRIKAKTHIWIAGMEALTNCLDPNVRRAALTDLLNRAGTAPAARLELGPAAYRKAVEKYIDVEPDK
jgi:hypothetical protein